MAFRQPFSPVDSSPNSRAESSHLALIRIGDQPVGRCQGLRVNGRTNNRPVNEIGAPGVVEFIAGSKAYQGTIQSVRIVYGDLIKRLASFTGTPINARSYSLMLSSFPDFEISVYRAGAPELGSPTLYADSGNQQQGLTGLGQLVETLIGCSIDSFESSMNVNDSLQMESVSFSFIDKAIKA